MKSEAPHYHISCPITLSLPNTALAHTSGACRSSAPAHALTHIQTRARTHERKHARARARTHTHTHTHAHARTHTHTHTCITFSVLFIILSLQHSFATDLYVPARYRLVGLVVKASASRTEGPGFESRLRRDFFGVESYQ